MKKLMAKTLRLGLSCVLVKMEEHIELMQLDKSNIRVSEYLTLLPSQKILQEKLHHAIERAQQKLLEEGNE